MIRLMEIGLMLVYRKNKRCKLFRDILSIVIYTVLIFCMLVKNGSIIVRVYEFGTDAEFLDDTAR